MREAGEVQIEMRSVYGLICDAMLLLDTHDKEEQRARVEMDEVRDRVKQAKTTLWTTASMSVVSLQQFKATKLAYIIVRDEADAAVNHHNVKLKAARNSRIKHAELQRRYDDLQKELVREGAVVIDFTQRAP